MTKSKAGVHLVEDLVLRAVQRDATVKSRFRRCDVKYPMRRRAALGSLDANGQFHSDTEVWCCDVSASGLGLLSSRAFTEGQIRQADLRNLGRSDAVVPVSITRCVKLIPGVYQITAAFVAEK